MVPLHRNWASFNGQHTVDIARSRHRGRTGDRAGGRRIPRRCCWANARTNEQRTSSLVEWFRLMWVCAIIRFRSSSRVFLFSDYSRELRGATAEISNFYNLSARFLIFDTHIPPITTHASKFRSCLSDFFEFWFFFVFEKKRAYFQNLSPRTNLKCMM